VILLTNQTRSRAGRAHALKVHIVSKDSTDNDGADGTDAYGLSQESHSVATQREKKA
jgi:hypothetical protein